MKYRFLRYIKLLVIILAAGIIIQKITFRIRNEIIIKKEYEDSIYYEKVLNAPNRSMQNYDITNDTVYIRKLEESTKKLIE